MTSRVLFKCCLRYVHNPYCSQLAWSSVELNVYIIRSKCNLGKWKLTGLLQLLTVKCLSSIILSMAIEERVSGWLKYAITNLFPLYPISHLPCGVFTSWNGSSDLLTRLATIIGVPHLPRCYAANATSWRCSLLFSHLRDILTPFGWCSPSLVMIAKQKTSACMVWYVNKPLEF